MLFHESSGCRTCNDPKIFTHICKPSEESVEMPLQPGAVEFVFGALFGCPHGDESYLRGGLRIAFQLQVELLEVASYNMLVAPCVQRSVRWCDRRTRDRKFLLASLPPLCKCLHCRAEVPSDLVNSFDCPQRVKSAVGGKRLSQKAAVTWPLSSSSRDDAAFLGFRTKRRDKNSMWALNMIQ